MMKLNISCILIVIFLIPLQGQVRHISAVEYESIVAALEHEMLEGKSKALRDLGSLLDKAIVEHRIRKILNKGCLFSKDEIDLNAPYSKKEFLDFYYDHKEKIYYSHLLNAFLISSPEDHTENILDIKREKVKRKRFESVSQQIKNAILTDNAEIVAKSFQQVKTIQQESHFLFLENLLKGEDINKASPSTQSICFKAIANIYRSSQMEKAIMALIRMMEKGQLKKKTGRAYLADLTNVHLGNMPTAQLSTKYTQLMDSLGSYEALRYHGYQMVFDFKPDYFDHEVDFLGKILSESSPYPWIMHNVLLDLKKVAHPRSIYYVAAQVYKYRPQWQSVPAVGLSLFTEWIADMTETSLAIPKQASGNLFYKTYFSFWAGQYKSYIWDDYYLKFVHIEEAAKKQESYDKLFRRLNSKNDSVALAAYTKLAQGDALEIKRLLTKYKQLLRRPNPIIPDMKYSFLEILSELSTYCREQDIVFEASDALLEKVNLLLEKTDDKTRFARENLLINHLTTSDITALEFQALIHHKNKDANYSFSRILDHVYSLKMEKMLEDPKALGFFLKKAALFQKIGIKGACNRYLKKLSNDNPRLKNVIHEILKTAADEAIVQQARLLFFDSRKINFNTVSDFIKFPEQFSEEQIDNLNAPAQKELESIFNILSTTEDIKNIKTFFYYLSLKPNNNFTPSVFKLLESDSFERFSKKKQIVITSHVISLLEKTYGLIFKEGKNEELLALWQKKWSVEKTSYKEWGKTFYQQTKDKLIAQEKVKATDINVLVSSPFFQKEKDLEVCLKMLDKLSALREISRLRMYQHFDVAQHLSYFEKFQFPPKVLDDIPQLFNMEIGHTAMLTFLLEQAAAYSPDEQGALLNKIMSSLWFYNYIQGLPEPNQQIKNIQHMLTVYLDEAEYMTEPEENATIGNIYKLQFIGKSLGEQLKIVRESYLDGQVKDQIKTTIISGLSYEKIGEMVTFLYESPNPTNQDYLFLKRDFGIPINNFNSKKELEDFIHRHKTLTPEAFYKHYLLAFQVDFITNDKLDYNKIYTILEADHVIPFAGNGGRRDFYNYGLIKLLEYHFDTRLGFHEKLNEGQDFFAFNSRKRSLSWQAFLKEKGFVKPDMDKVPSFNREIAYN